MGGPAPAKGDGQRQAPLWLLAIAFGIAFFAAAELTGFLSPRRGGYVSFWLPGGIYVAALLLRPRREWPWFAAGAMVANLAFDMHLGTSVPTFLIFFVANSAQAFSGAWLMRRFVADEPRLESLREFVGLIVFCALIGPAVGATIGTATLVAEGSGRSFVSTWLIWWGSNAMSVLLVTPFCLTWCVSPAANPFARVTPKRIAEVILLFGSMTVMTWYMLVVDRGVHAPYKSRLMPFLLWAALRLGVRGSTAATLFLAIFSAILVEAFHKGLTPAEIASGQYVLTLQTFLVISSLMTLAPAIVLRERDRTLLDLSRSQRRFETLAAAAFEGIVISEGGRILEVNDQVLQMLGYTREEMVGKHVTAFVSPESRQVVADAVQAGREAVYEHRLLRKDGAPRYVEVQARMSQDDGRQVRMTALRDVSDRKRTEEALAASEALLRQFIKHAPAAIAMLDKDMRYLQASDRWLTDYHLDGKDIVGKSHYELFPDLPAEWKAVHQRALAGAVERHEEDPFPRADGTMDWLQWEVRPWRTPDGQVGGLMFFAQIITERRKTEENKRLLEAQLLQAQKMEAVGTLAGGIAHDFNNILGAILGNVELVRLELGAEHPVLDSVDEIGRAGRRARALVRQILSFSRQHEASREVIRLADVVREAAGLLRSTLPATVELVTTIRDEAVTVSADPVQVHQILVNLGTNAWHALGEGAGRIDIQVAAIELPSATTFTAGALQPGRYAELRVTDTGAGMDRAMLARIFEPFFTTKPVGVGTGLGLSVVHGIVEDHGGAIDVSSRLGVGSTFRVLFPAVAAEAVVPIPQRTDLPRGSGQSVLYLDDEEPLVRLTERLLGHLGYRVSGFTRPDEALHAVRTAPNAFDLVVTDFNMPVMSGLEVASLLASIRPDLPVILASGFVSDDLRQRAAAIGVKHVLYKPNTVEEMCEAVHRLASRDNARA